MTAVKVAADSQAAYNPGFVAYPYLAEFNPGFENGDQILNQFPEVHPVFGGKEEKYLGVFQKIMNRHKLHFQLVISDLYLADIESFFFQLFVALDFFQIFPGSKPFDADNLGNNLGAFTLDRPDNLGKVFPVTGRNQDPGPAAQGAALVDRRKSLVGIGKPEPVNRGIRGKGCQIRPGLDNHVAGIFLGGIILQRFDIFVRIAGYIFKIV
jgi:hypothetical protein